MHAKGSRIGSGSAACLLKLSKSTLCLSFNFWIQFFSQPVGKKVDAHNQGNQSGAGKDDHPPHASGKLMGVFMHSFSRSGNLNFLKHFYRSLPALASGTIFMQLKHLGNLIADGIHWVKRCHGFLKDHGDSISPDGSHLFHGKRDDIRSVKKDFTVYDPARRFRDKAHDGLRRHTFAAAGLSHDAEYLPLVDEKGNIINCSDNALEGIEIGLEFLNMQEMAVVVHSVFVQGNSFELRYTGTRLADI